MLRVLSVFVDQKYKSVTLSDTRSRVHGRTLRIPVEYVYTVLMRNCRGVITRRGRVASADGNSSWLRISKRRVPLHSEFVRAARLIDLENSHDKRDVSHTRARSSYARDSPATIIIHDKYAIRTNRDRRCRCHDIIALPVSRARYHYGPFIIIVC